MDVVEFYERLLHPPAPWQVVRVSVTDEPQQRVDVWLEEAPGAIWRCPECGATVPGYDHSEERGWRHLDSCEHETWMHARLPRVRCPKHGVRQVPAPLAAGSARQTVALERRCIDTLQESSCSGAARLLRLSWDEVAGVMDRAVGRGLALRSAQLPSGLGIDEKAVFRRHHYFTIITDLGAGTVREVLKSRRRAAVEDWLASQQAALPAVQTVALDLSAGYAGAVRARASHATLCFDHFHVQQVVARAMDEVRKGEQRTLPPERRRAFFRSRFLFLFNAENVPPERAAEFAELKRRAVKTSRAWALKEAFRRLWEGGTVPVVTARFKAWYWWATHARLPPLAKAAKTIKEHWAGVLAAITKGVSNGCTEGLNCKIEQIKREAFGFRNPDRLRTAILFHCGGLSLYPELDG